MNEIKEVSSELENIVISQTVAILVDGDNIERSIHTEANDTNIQNHHISSIRLINSKIVGQSWT